MGSRVPPSRAPNFLVSAPTVTSLPSILLRNVTSYLAVTSDQDMFYARLSVGISIGRLVVRSCSYRFTHLKPFSTSRRRKGEFGLATVR